MRNGMHKDVNTTSWYRDGKLHREDGPAIVWNNGSKEWYINDQLHREDGPAIELSDGSKEWHKNGIEYTDGSFSTKKINEQSDFLPKPLKNGIFNSPDYKAWYIVGQLHREDGPAIIWNNGSKEWFINNERHREDGPAIEFPNGHKEWWNNGQLHREDGPAIIKKNGDKEWFLNGVEKTESEFILLTASKVNLQGDISHNSNMVPQNNETGLKSALQGVSRIVSTMLNLREKKPEIKDSNKPSV